MRVLALLNCLIMVAAAASCSSTAPTDHPNVASDASEAADLAAVDSAGTTDGPGPDAPGRDTWDSFAMGFFATYCITCHSGGRSPEDFRTLAGVGPAAALIRCGVAPMMEPGCGKSPAPRQFPIGNGPHPSDSERARIVAWIDGGLP
jgi:hypothetical protein